MSATKVKCVKLSADLIEAIELKCAGSGIGTFSARVKALLRRDLHQDRPEEDLAKYHIEPLTQQDNYDATLLRKMKRLKASRNDGK